MSPPSNKYVSTSPPVVPPRARLHGRTVSACQTAEPLNASTLRRCCHQRRPRRTPGCPAARLPGGPLRARAAAPSEDHTAHTPHI